MDGTRRGSRIVARRVKSCSIRRAVAADARELALLRFEFRAGLADASEPPEAFVERCAHWMADRLEADSAWRCWVACDDARIVGMIWLNFIDKLPNPAIEAEHHAYITSLYLQPEMRGRGVGSSLLARSLDACREAGVDAIILWPTPESRTLYARHGFAVRDDLMECRG